MTQATAVLLAVHTMLLAVGTAKLCFKLSEICLHATAFAILIKSFFGIQLRLLSIHEDGHFLIQSC